MTPHIGLSEKRKTMENNYERHQRYFKSNNGKRALNRAQKAYDKKNPEKRRKQKRDYMRRKRAEDPNVLR